MPKVSVLLEFDAPQDHGFTMFTAALESAPEAESQATSLLDRVAGLGVELEEPVPVPMFSSPQAPKPVFELTEFGTSETSPDLPSQTVVVAAQAESDRLEELSARPDVRVWPNSDLTLYQDWGISEADVADPTSAAAPAAAAGGVDCRPFRPGVSVDRIRDLLGVPDVWERGTGNGVRVAIIDEGVNGDAYPVVGGLQGQASQPGTAPITSHGSMCAADVLIAAPDAELYDYPFLGPRNSGDALAMFQGVLEQRRLDGTPQVANNSYGFTGVPDQQQFPNHEIWDFAHPMHRKVREVVATGVVVFFAAGNCGENCPSGNCHVTGIGPGHSIHGSNSLIEVITIAAVNSEHERIGYSSQGPGMFEQEKPDLASYSHVFGNFGPGRPGGLDQPFDNGTSAATPVAAGVAALLLSAFPNVTRDDLLDALVGGATQTTNDAWDPDFGRGIINAASACAILAG
jgi:subtilisin family serine protease